MFEKKKENKINKILAGLCIILGILLIAISYLYLKEKGIFPKVYNKNASENTDCSSKKACAIPSSSGSTENTEVSTGNTETEALTYTGKIEDLTITFIEDKREASIKVDQFVENLKKEVPSVKNAKIVIKDFSDEGIKDFLKKNNISNLPAVIFSTKNFDGTKDPQDFKPFLQELPNGEYSLNIGANYDPFYENCSNGIDDNEDGKIDCEDEKCSSNIICTPKVDKPVAELFIMSYCPYGLQAEKGFLEAMLKLDKVSDMKVRFVSYLMHGEKEGEENIVQYCIQKDQNDKFKDYLKCFLVDGNNANCIESTKIDSKKLETCITETKKSINYDENTTDKSRRFPLFSLDETDNIKYGVQGSPTFVLNGIKVENVGRNAKAYAELICSTFKEKPAVCNEEFNDVNYDPNFGFTTNGKAVGGACGG